MQITVNSGFYSGEVFVTDGNTRIDLGYLNSEERRKLAEELLEAVYELTYNEVSTEDHYSFVLEHGSGASDMVAVHKDDFEHYQKRDAQLEYALDMIPNLDDVLEQMENN